MIVDSLDKSVPDSPTDIDLLMLAFMARIPGMNHQERVSLWARWVGSGPHSPDEWVEFPSWAAEQTGWTGTVRSWRAKMEHARREAESWSRRGVTVVVSGGGLAKPFRPLMVWGAIALLEKPLAAVLNSRKPLRMDPDDRWIRLTKRMAESAVREGYVLLASVGTRTHELVAAMAVRGGTGLVVVLDGLLPPLISSASMSRFMATYGSLFPSEHTLFVSPFIPWTLPRRAERPVARDECLIGLARKVFVAEIRSGGLMERLNGPRLEKTPTEVFHPDRFDRFTGGNRKLLLAGAMPWHLREDRDKRPAAVSAPADSMSRRATMDREAWLFHLTRAHPGPWPGQKLAAYYDDLIDSREGAAHAAFDTLRRILDEGRLRASSRLIRGGWPVVAFSALDWADLEELVRWRRALTRWAVESCGLAVSRKFLLELGARPVLYGDETFWNRLPEESRFRFQSRGNGRDDWTREREWRLAGDLDLRSVPPDRIKVVVSSLEEARTISERYAMTTILFPGGGPHLH